ncbi:hypothetical protein Syn7502_02357 [Synechococcus sp. PCC 7502]|uniref:hypothetical protein n=1 Tax=Synechococcus sp. PCC 7502 TaxID=1173263 RepID=UPI00029F94E6|nr:hypothetical protein [Synechococcus sp. PCC 7502]AFY74348.1 hypothetical protein Syn7502_02357 [Synechococcus sp. PCC 7502]
MNKPVQPDPQKAQRTVLKLQEVCRQFDALNFTLDELIAQIDEEIRNSPLTIYRLKKNHETQSV